MRTGLVGVSAAVAIGAIGVSSGVLPGGDTFTLGGGGDADRVQSADIPSDLRTTDGGLRSAPESPSESPSARTHTPSASTTPSRRPRSGAATTSPPADKPAPHRSSAAPRTHAPAASPSDTPSSEAPSPVQSTLSQADAAAEQVLALVNQERAKVGCQAVRGDSSLASLAAAFSADMAARGFFDHTDPDGATPWDRAQLAGVENLGGENIARGQADARAVMESWMASPGHRANILNCDYTTLGVGVHFGPGGPWWTQDFGF